MKQLIALFLFLGGALLFVLIAGGILTFQQIQLANRPEVKADEEVDEVIPTVAQVMRSPQPVRLDLTWVLVEPENNQWNFETADAMVNVAEGDIVARVFAHDKPSGAPPWEGDGGAMTFGTEAKDYLATVIDRYGDRVQFWQLGNAMDAWQAAEGTPDPFPLVEQAAFLREAALYIRDRDEDAVIVLPSIRELNTYSIGVWLPEILAGDQSWFDVVAYEYAGDWKQFGGQHDVLTATLSIAGAEAVPLWLMDVRAIDQVESFKIVVQAYGSGDAFVRWNIPVPLAEGLFGFKRVEPIAQSLSSENVYRFDFDVGSTYVVWGAGMISTPDEVVKYVPLAFGTEEHAWESVPSGGVLELSQHPLLLTR